MLGGLQLLASGIIGKYLAKTFIEVKKRPNYIIKESNIKSEDEPLNNQKGKSLVM